MPGLPEARTSPGGHRRHVEAEHVVGGAQPALFHPRLVRPGVGYEALPPAIVDPGFAHALSVVVCL